MFKHILIALAFFALTALGAPTVVASQSTATSGVSHSINVPAGAAGDMLIVVIAPDYDAVSAPISYPSGWSQRAGTMCSRYAGIYYRVSDGTETTVTLTSAYSIAAQSHVIRVSGLTLGFIAFNQKPYNAGSGTNAPDPNNITVSTYGDALYIAGTFYNGAAPTLHPAGYGFPLDAQNTVNLSMSFKSALGPSDNPGPFALPSTQKACAFGIGLR